MNGMNIQRGDIYYVERFGIQVGCEQQPGRPAVVVSCEENNRHSLTVEIVYMTTRHKADLPTHVLIHSAPQESTVLCEQITTVSVERLGDYIGRCTKDEMFQIDVALLASLGIKIPSLKEYIENVRNAPVPGLHESPEQMNEGNVQGDAERGKYRRPGVKELQSVTNERDTYKALYEQLLDRLIQACARPEPTKASA